MSFFLQSDEKNFPSFLSTDTEIYYFRYLHFSLHQVSQQYPIREDLVIPFMAFIRYMIRSNLCFDIAFSLPIHQKQSKLALMYGDYFLARAGASFQPFVGYPLLGNLLVDTLKRIAKSQWLQSEPVLSQSSFFKTVFLRYGSIFQFCMKAPSLMNQKPQEWNKEKTVFANAMSLYCTLLKNKPLTFQFEKKRCKTIELMKLQKFLPT